MQLCKPYTVFFFVFCCKLAAFGQAEKVYLHFDGPAHKFGDTCWFKAYIVSGPGYKLSNISKVLYVDWLDQHFNLIEQQKLRITNGQAEGNFVFSYHVSSGIYIARAYTRWMRNEDPAFFFKKLFNITANSSSHRQPRFNEIKNRLNVNFFPEGGNMVEGIKTRVALRVSNENGEGVDVAGDIFDDHGTKITPLKTTYGGMAVLPFIPGGGKYSFRLPSGKTFDLPVADKAGVVMNVNNNNPNKLFVAIEATADNVNKEYKLTGSAAGELCYRGTVVLRKTRVEFMINKADLPSGVIRLTLTDNAGLRLCERMVFINNINKDLVHLRSGIAEDSVLLNLQTDNKKLKTAHPALSLSISYDTGAHRDDNIFPYLLLTSESKTPVQLPAGFFGLQTPHNTFIVDLIMLTHDFRKTDLVDKRIKNPNWQPEQSLTLRGRATDAYSQRPFKDGVITLVIDDHDYKGIYTTEIDAHGNFKIDDIDYTDSTLLVWQYRDKKGKIRPADVELHDSVDIPPIDTTLKMLVATHLSQRKMHNDTMATTDDRYQLLEEVVVTGAPKKVRALGAGTILVIPDKDDMKLPASVFVSGYAIGLPFLKPVTRDDGSIVWLTTSNAGVTLLVDGHDVDEFGNGVNPYHYLLAYQTEEIEYVTVSGSNYTGYVISVKTNENAFRRPPNFVQRYGRGYKTIQPFNGATAYWNPDLKTDETGAATVRFENIAREPLSVVLQGVGGDGEIIDVTLHISPPL